MSEPTKQSIDWARAACAWERIADLHRREARRAEKAALNCRQRAGIHVPPLTMEEAAAIADVAKEEGARDAAF